VKITVTTGQAAARTGLTRKAMRVYEAKGLLDQPARSAAGYRLYTADDIAVLTFIRQARTLGLHLEDIAEILTIHRRGTSPCDAVRELIDTRVAEITAAIADLRTLRGTLIQARNTGECPCPTTQVCAIIEQPDLVHRRRAPERSLRSKLTQDADGGAAG
jgi:DNA-binding transcriptional MerR regulator